MTQSGRPSWTTRKLVTARMIRGQGLPRLHRRPQGRDEAGGGVVSVVRLRSEHLHERIADRRRDCAVERVQPRVGLLEPLGDHRLRRLPLERGHTTEHLVQHTPEAVQVATAVDVLGTYDLLGTHVLGRPDGDASLSEARTPGRADGSRDPEIGDHGVTIGQQDVGRLDITVDNVLTVRVAQGTADFPYDVQGFAQRQRALPRNASPEGLPLHVRHDVVQQSVGITGIVQRNDVGVVEAGGSVDLPQEPLGTQRGREFGPQDLDRHRPTVLEVLGEIHDGHPATPDLALDRVAVANCSLEAVEELDQRPCLQPVCRISIG
jgi:hypothetical protein